MSYFDRGKDSGRDRYYKESLTYEEKFQFQIDNIIVAFNADDVRMIAATVDTLQRLVTLKMMDLQYDRDIKEWQKEYDLEKQERQKKYEQDVKDAMCPDVIDKPVDMPSKALYDKKFYIIMDLLERRGLLLKERVTGYL